MKVICIAGSEINVGVELTVGKEYEVIDFINLIRSEDYYKIINDRGYFSYYNRNRFKTINEIRIEKLKKIK